MEYDTQLRLPNYQIVGLLLRPDMFLRLQLTIICICSCMYALAQQAPAKAERLYDKGVYYKAAHQQRKACDKLERAIEVYPAYAEACSQLGQWYFEAHEFRKATNIFTGAFTNCKNGHILFALPLARCLIFTGKADSALRLINAFATIKDSTEWNKLREQATFVKRAMLNASPDKPQNLGLRVNTPYPELFPNITVDTQTLYFTRRVNNIDEDFYSAQIDTCGGWLHACDLGSPPNTPEQESSQAISADGHYLFFCRCGNKSEDGWAEGGCDLYMAYRISPDSSWTIPEAFGATINTNDYEGMPALSPDNRELYFVSDRAGGYGGYDIWVSHFEEGLWQPPVNAGPIINTAGNETAPYMHIDNKTLYFTSDGHPGLGGTDIFVTKRLNDTAWKTPVNLGYPINTSANEKSECVTPDGRKIYFSSDRDSLAGNYDIYESPLPDAMQPTPVSYITGYIYDSLAKSRLNYASIYVVNAQNGDTLSHFQSNRGDGSFIITLPVGITYALHVARMGYTEVLDTLTFDRQYLQDPIVRNITMLPADYVKPINDSMLGSVYFDKNSTSLSDSNIAYIRRVMEPWAGQKDIIVLVNGYTDNSGTPMLNEGLSYKRAGLVAQEISAMDIDEQLVHAKGWGETNNIAPNDTEEGQQKNRRVDIIVRR